MKHIGLICCFILISCNGDKADEQDEMVELETKMPEREVAKKPETSTTQDLVHPMPGGDHREYHPNGQLKIEGQYDMNSLRTGLWVSYYENGIKWSESYYSAGKRDGHTLSFFPNGKPRYIGEYKNDIKTGPWTFYDENGNIVKEETY